jgi:hypothetical protein
VKTTFILFTLTVACAATAQPIEAARYVNAQGVEILVSRSSPKPQDSAALETAAIAAQPAPTTARSAKEGKADAAAVLARNEHRVSPTQQAARDDERQRILTQELLDEEQQLETKRRALRSPRAASDLSAIDLRKVNDAVARHESNIKSLNRELGMLKPVAGKSRDVTLDTVLR